MILIISQIQILGTKKDFFYDYILALIATFLAIISLFDVCICDKYSKRASNDIINTISGINKERRSHVLNVFKSQMNKSKDEIKLFDYYFGEYGRFSSKSVMQMTQFEYNYHNMKEDSNLSVNTNESFDNDKSEKYTSTALSVGKAAVMTPSHKKGPRNEPLLTSLDDKTFPTRDLTTMNNRWRSQKEINANGHLTSSHLTQNQHQRSKRMRDRTCCVIGEFIFFSMFGHTGCCSCLCCDYLCKCFCVLVIKGCCCCSCKCCPFYRCYEKDYFFMMQH